MSIAEAVDREVAWLKSTGDGLPELLKPAGLWDIVQAYPPRTGAARRSGIYALYPLTTEKRISNARKMQTYQFRHRLDWPIGGTTVAEGFWEQEHRNFAAAIDLLMARVRGLLGDHTHGGRFRSVAEEDTGGKITVHFQDEPDTRTQGVALLRAHITYSGDGYDFTA